MKFRRVIFVLLLFALFCSVLTVASSAHGILIDEFPVGGGSSGDTESVVPESTETELTGTEPIEEDPSDSDNVDSETSDISLIDDPAYVESKGSIFDLVYTFWYWIFGDAFDTSEKICTLLSVITIVWAIYLLIPRRKAV